jgi:uncharacterized membrane protein YtjA (UPF0391 family)
MSHEPALRSPIASCWKPSQYDVRHRFCTWWHQTPSHVWQGRGGIMLYYALVFLVVALIAGVLGVSGVAAVASQIAWVLFVIAIVLFIVHFVSGRRTLAP